MYSGNHGYSTPVDTIVEAALRLKHREDIVFMFIGAGVGKQVVEDAIAEHNPGNLVSLPYQPFDQIKYSLSAADVHLVSVGNEVVGVVHPCKVYGAMALSRPILLLGPDPCHVTDLLEKRSFGWHIGHGDVDGAVKVIEEMAALEPAELQAMGQAASETIQQDFNRGKMVSEFVNVITRGIPKQDG